MKKRLPSDAARRGIQLALCMATDAVEAGWEARLRDLRDLESARKWLQQSFAARSCK